MAAQVDALFTGAEPRTITAEQVGTILKNIIDAAFLAEDDYTYPAEVETINVTSATLGVTVDGEKVVGEQQAAVPVLTAETATAEDVAETVNDIITKLENHGLIAPNA